MNRNLYKQALGFFFLSLLLSFPYGGRFHQWEFLEVVSENLGSVLFLFVPLAVALGSIAVPQKPVAVLAIIVLIHFGCWSIVFDQLDSKVATLPAPSRISLKTMDEISSSMGFPVLVSRAAGAGWEIKFQNSPTHVDIVKQRLAPLSIPFRSAF